MAHSPITGLCLTDDPDTNVTEVALGLTMYLDDPLHWAQRGAGQALDAFLLHAPADRLAWYTTSMVPEWHRAGASGARMLTDMVSSERIDRIRHLFSFELVDNTDVPKTGFVYREYDPGRGGPRASVLEISLLQQTDPQALVALTTAIAQIGPFHCGVGGFAARWNPFEKNTSFTEIHGWTRRYLGLDVGDADAMSWDAVEGLPGTTWLTLIGPSLAAAREIDLAALASLRWDDVTATAVGGGLLLQAGAEPTTGDRNRLTYHKAYAEVARVLAPYFVEEPPELGGKFWREKHTRPWQRRFLEPDARQ